MKKPPLALIAVMATSTLALTGCSSDSDASPVDNGAPAGSQSEAETFEFQYPRFVAEGEMTIRIPEALIEAARGDADGLLVSEVRATARELDSSRYCAVDLSVAYRGAGLGVLGEVAETEAEYAQRAEDSLANFLKAELNAATLDEAKVGLLEAGWSSEEADAYLEEVTMEGFLGPYVATSVWSPLDSTPIGDLDSSDPKTGRYISTDHETLTFVEDCAASPADDGDAARFEFPVLVDGKIKTFASVEITTMKSGTLTVTENEVSNYTRDSNGDWIGG